MENEHYEELKTLLFTDSAVASEAAALGMGLIALGSGSERVCDEMLAYARETEHEKIVRGLAMGMALICYGREDDADEVIRKLSEDKNPILRYGGMYAVALAYCGTADNKAIRMLLHSAVADVSDDVRRAAVIALGFVLFRHPKQLPRIVALLSESCHAHVRYGAAMAIGIACMGTGMSVAVDILERLTADTSDFVRQGALIGLALVFMHHTEERSPKSAEIRKLFETTWSAKLEDAVTRFGAVVAAGLIDAGGRNGTISFTSGSGHSRMTAIVGVAMFTQFWYWYPLVHFIGLSIKPAALIALNQDLKMPKLKMQSNAPGGMYDYVPSGPPEKSKEASRAPTAVLSVTAKVKAREIRRAAKRAKAAEEGGVTSEGVDASDSGMTDVDSSARENSTKDAESSQVEDTKEKEDGKHSEEAKNCPAVLENPCRVLPAQEKYMSWDVTEDLRVGSADEVKGSRRYSPIMKGRVTGIVLVRDAQRGDPEDLVEMQSLTTVPPPQTTAASSGRPLAPTVQAEEDDGGEEVEPPEPFVYTDEENASGGDGAEGVGQSGSRDGSSPMSDQQSKQ